MKVRYLRIVRGISFHAVKIVAWMGFLWITGMLWLANNYSNDSPEARKIAGISTLAVLALLCVIAHLRGKYEFLAKSWKFERENMKKKWEARCKDLLVEDDYKRFQKKVYGDMQKPDEEKVPV